jgi:hypothetical protein
MVKCKTKGLKYIITKERGSAFVLATAFVLLSLWAVMIFQTHLRSGLAVYEASSSVQSTGVLQAGMGKALALMETGTLPQEMFTEPDSEYYCKFSTQGVNVALVYGYNQVKSAWDISASTRDEDVSFSSCTCPSVFYSTSTDNLWTNCN